MLTQAYAAAGMYNWPLLDSVSRAAKARLQQHDFNEASLVNLTESFARLKFNVRPTWMCFAAYYGLPGVTGCFVFCADSAKPRPDMRFMHAERVSITHPGCKLLWRFLHSGPVASCQTLSDLAVSR